jgi:hypothetical protein
MSTNEGGYGDLTPLSTIFQLYHGVDFIVFNPVFAHINDYLIYNSEDNKASHSDFKNLLKNMHNFSV